MHASTVLLLVERGARGAGAATTLARSHPHTGGRMPKNSIYWIPACGDLVMAPFARAYGR
jgi:hypothetical protein